MSKRVLTSGEIVLAKKIFKDSIDYIKVSIHNVGYGFFQPNESGMTPNGEIYIKGSNSYSSDYSQATPTLQALFIHEMVHVWQYQNDKLNPIWSAIGNSILHGFDYAKAYHYTLAYNKDLLDYRMEQQAQIIEDYFHVFELKGLPRPGQMQNKVTQQERDKLLKSVLKKFLADPKY